MDYEAACGCQANHDYPNYALGITFCPLHEATPDLLVALKHILENQQIPTVVKSIAEMALAKTTKEA